MDWYYNFMNIDSYVQKKLIKDGCPICELHYIKDIICTKMSMFKVNNINKIDGLTNQILFAALMFSNHLCFYKNAGLGGWVLCRYLSGSTFNKYYRPKTVNLIALNGESIANDVPFEDIVLVRDNEMDIIPFLTINEYIQKINKVENTIFKVLDITSLPLAVVGSKKMSTQLKTVAKQLGSENAFIIGDDTLPDIVKAFDIKVPVNPLDLYELKQKYRNECLASLGIYSVEEKRERIVTQELVNQNDYTDFVYQDTKMELERFIKELNDKDPTLQLTLIETYEVNSNEAIEEKAKEVKETTKAEQENLKDNKEENKDA